MFSRADCKLLAKKQLRSAKVSFILFAALYTLIQTMLSTVDAAISGNTYEELFASGVPGIFVFTLAGLIGVLLSVGTVVYCMIIRRGERAEYSDLFDGFSYAFKIIEVTLLCALLVGLGFILIVPGFILLYRYRYAIYLICENPDMAAVAALKQSAAETKGFKLDLFVVDLSFFGWVLLASLPGSILEFCIMYFKLNIAAPVYAAASSLLLFPLSLVLLYRTTADLNIREKILALRKGPADTSV